MRFRCIPLVLLGLVGCVSRTPKPPSETRFQPAGVVRLVNRSERYVIFESIFPFTAGQELRVISDGRRSGLVRVLGPRERPYYAADLLEGAAKPGDIVE